MSAPEKPPLNGSRSPATGRASRPYVDLPAANTKRWSSRRKAAVVIAIRSGNIARMEARTRYALSEEELAGWEIAFARRGILGLRSGVRNSYARSVNITPAQPASHEPE
jgi:hypothetical protein